eukprot:TRINITY_DN30182_c0_g1_i1.p1 TRINITY_DN30182_c0_g1~~TRINITY_DN30182_c0_g1_i1.p1  ORF type:complete len:341 (+),score=118.75 TRINITY_DN30182_c0_g1_i1:52-1074(+)
MAPKAKPEPEPELLMLALVNGMDGTDLAAVLDAQKSSSKSCGTHKARQMYWEAYGKLVTKAQNLDAGACCMLRFDAIPGKEGEGKAEVVELTKRQRGLVNSLDFMGRKLKPLENKESKAWCIVWAEEEAQRAWNDLHDGEACVAICPDGVYVCTRYKRVLCKALSGPLKTVKEADALVAELAPEKPLRSVSFSGNEPPTPNGYNTFLVSMAKVAKELAPNGPIGHCNGSTTSEMYDYFEQRRNGQLINEANKLIGQMLTDVNKGQTPLIACSTKEAAVAFKNALMKKVYVHESFGKFINAVRKEGGVELWEIKGDVDNTDFGKYNKIVFEMFYRVDLTTF